ncbi:MAG: HNH endonuclease [Actinobacteria bacterium]|nr:HNH endonuclease [Actinomycetota bacterium]
MADIPLERLESEITELAAHINAATCRWLLLVAEFDRREGWGTWECRSCAHWLNWKCGIDLGAARERVRVARALGELPEITASFAAGQLSYSKVRALTRVATPETEGALLEMARQGTAAHLERIVRAYRKAQRVDEMDEANRIHEDRSLRWHHDDDGTFVLQARLTPEQGALVRKALERAGEAVDDVSAETSEERRTHAQCNADALVAVAESFLASDQGDRHGGDRHLVTVHVDAEVLAAGGEGRCELDDGPAIAAEVARRLSCDASVVAIVDDGHGNPLDVGRKTRAIPPALRRALASRDGGCRVPGCTSRRFVDGHHIRHWSRGGDTSLPNLVSLCRAHHRALHEGGYAVEATGDPAEPWVFRRPDGTALPSSSPALPATTHRAITHHDQGLGLDIGPATAIPGWYGEQLDLGLALDALFSREGHPSPIRPALPPETSRAA